MTIMPITLTELDDSTSVPRTFTLIGRDRYASEWLNTEQSSAEYDSRIYIKQTILTQKSGAKLRRVLVQAVNKKPGISASGKPFEEMVVANLTMTLPVMLTELDLNEANDPMIFIRSLTTVGVLAQLIRGEV